MSLLHNEFLKTFSKWRSYIAFVTIAIVVPLVMIAVKLQGEMLTKSLAGGLAQDIQVPGNIVNGYFVTFFLMNALWIHIPFLIALGAGDQLAGEAAGGTFRLLLTRPASRSQILWAKYVTTLFYTTAVVGFLVALCLALGAALLGTGDLLFPGRALIVIPEAEVLWRLLLAAGLATWGMWAVASLAFLFSSLVDNALGPILGTLAVIIVFYVIAGIPVDLFKVITPYLFTSHLNIWQKAIEQPIPWPEIVRSALVLGGFDVGFYCLTWYIFVKKDILS
jgi:ABC-2 type transport system permease protein